MPTTSEKRYRTWENSPVAWENALFTWDDAYWNIYTRSDTETLTVAEKEKTSGSKRLQETIATAEQARRKVLWEKTFPEPLIIFLERYLDYQNFIQFCTERFGVSETASQQAKYMREYMDGFGMADSLMKSGNKFLRDVLRAEGKLPLFHAGKLTKETASVTDAEPYFSAGKTAKDAFAVSDDTPTWDWLRVLRDSLGLTDNNRTALSAGKFLSDFALFADTQSFGAKKTNHEIVTAADSTEFGSVKKLFDALSLADEATARRVFVRFLTEAIAIQTAAKTAAGYFETCYDRIVMTDGAERKANYHRTIAEPLIVFLEKYLDYQNFIQFIAESLSCSDGSDRQASYMRMLTDALGLSDAARSAAGYFRTSTEAWQTIDAHRAAAGIHKGETLAASELAGKSMSLPKEENLSTTETPKLAADILQREYMTGEETHKRQAEKPLAEAVSLAEWGNRLYGKRYEEIVSFAEKDMRYVDQFFREVFGTEEFSYRHPSIPFVERLGASDFRKSEIDKNVSEPIILFVEKYLDYRNFLQFCAETFSVAETGKEEVSFKRLFAEQTEVEEYTKQFASWVQKIEEYIHAAESKGLSAETLLRDGFTLWDTARKAFTERASERLAAEDYAKQAISHVEQETVSTEDAPKKGVHRPLRDGFHVEDDVKKAVGRYVTEPLIVFLEKYLDYQNFIQFCTEFLHVADETDRESVFHRVYGETM